MATRAQDTTGKAGAKAAATVKKRPLAGATASGRGKSRAAKKKAEVTGKKTAVARKKRAAPKKKTMAGTAAGAGTAPVAAKKRATAARKKGAVARKNAAARPAATGKGAIATRTPAQSLAQRIDEQPLMTALRAEHRHMAGVMKLFSEQLHAIEDGKLVDTHVVYEIMEYMVKWPDRYHHPREDLIYSRAAEMDARAADSVDSLQREHDEMITRGHAVLANIEGWREGVVSGQMLVESGRDYIERTYAHMNTEEQLVFPQIEELLSGDDWRELAADDQLRPMSDPVFGPRVQREFRNLARKLRRNVRRSVERGTMVEWIGIEALMESLEVLSMANDAARAVTSDHIRGAWQDSLELFREAPLTAPFRSAANNTRQALRWLGEVVEISRDTLGDLSRVNQERRDRIRLLDRA